MSRSFIVASFVFGLIIPIGFVVIPFTVEIGPAVIEGADSSGSSAIEVSCGNLIEHYLNGSENTACGSAAGIAR